MERGMMNPAQLDRVKAEGERIKKQKEAVLERRSRELERLERSEALNNFELKKLATQRRWDGKWERRKTKIDAKRY